MVDCNINVLGTAYTISYKNREDDETLKTGTCDGYCDKTSKSIVVCNKDSEADLDDFDAYQKTCVRHEIIHAFLFESGLHGNFKHEQWGHDETMVDWFAVQFPKILKCYQYAGVI